MSSNDSTNGAGEDDEEDDDEDDADETDEEEDDNEDDNDEYCNMESFEAHQGDTNHVSDYNRNDSARELHAAINQSEKWVEETFNEFLELIFQLCLSICTETFDDGQPDSTLLVYFSGVLGFSADCRGFLLAKQYCPYLSGLIYIQRLLLLERALPLQAYSSIGIEKCPQGKQSERFGTIRRKFMVLGSQSPLDELLSLRNYGLCIARTEPPSTHFQWSDDGETLSCGDLLLSMEKFRKLPAYFIENAEKICNSLMFGLEPSVDLTIIKDSLVNFQEGYSFVTHQKNNLSKSYLELLVRAYTSHGDGLSNNGQWNKKSVDVYLKLVTQLEEQLAGGLYTACGQCPRASELLSLQCESDFSTPCGISIWNGFVIYLLRNNKSKRLTNREFFVARFLPLRLGRVMYKYLTCIRRVAAILRREQLGWPQSYTPQRLLFHSNGRPWPPSRLTLILEQATTEVWQQKVNIRLYRQISIAITERHVLEVHLPLNRYDDESTDADLNVAFSWQSGHRPLQRGITYGLNGAFPDRLQPALLRAYQWTSTLWHQFIRQPSREIGSHSTTATSQSIVSPSASKSKRTAADAFGSGTTPSGHAMAAKRPKGSSLVDALIEQRQKSKSKRERMTQESTRALPTDTQGSCQETPYLTYIPNLRLLGCSTCATMITRQRIKAHLRGSPHRLKGVQMRKTLIWGSTLDIINDNVELDKLPFLPEDSLPIVILGQPHTGGFRCTLSAGSGDACRFVGSGRRRIREHLREKHGWDEQVKPGRRSTATLDLEANSSPWRSGVYYQRLFLTGPRSEWFEVARGHNLQVTETGEYDIEHELHQTIEATRSEANNSR
jgi:hypothetical protein